VTQERAKGGDPGGGPGLWVLSLSWTLPSLAGLHRCAGWLGLTPAASPDALPAHPQCCPPFLTPLRKLLTELQRLWVCPNPGGFLCPSPACGREVLGAGTAVGGLAPLTLGTQVVPGSVPADVLADKSRGGRSSPHWVVTVWLALGTSPGVAGQGSGCG